jgi:uncharacterized membrane protein
MSGKYVNRYASHASRRAGSSSSSRPSRPKDNLEQAFREFTAKTLSKEQRPSIRKVLTAAKQKAAQQPKRAKEKIKQRELER